MFSENEREGIKVEAQALLKRFSEKLSNLDLEELRTVNSQPSMRRSGKSSISNANFRENMFNNAPQKEGDFIIAERKQW